MKQQEKIWSEAKEGDTPFVVSLSEKMRLAINLERQILKDDRSMLKVKEIANDVVKDIEAADGVADSLRQPSPLGFVTRQVDIRNDDQQLMLKTFVTWNKQLDCWLLFVEGPDEQYWETRHKSIGVG